MLITQANLTLFGGAERVVLKIAQHYRAKIITAEYSRVETFREFAKLDIEVIGRGKGVLPYGRVMQGLKYGLGFYNFKVDDDYDVINAHIAPSHWIRNRNEHVLWYCHTPLRDVYDLYALRMARKKAYQKPLHFIGIKAVKRIDQSIVKRIEYIVANSENTKSRIEKYFGRNDAFVLGGGVEYEKYASKGDSQYFLYPSRISPNKRQEFAITAFKIFSMSKKGYKLIITGAVSKDPFYYDYYKRVLQLAGNDPNIIIMDSVGEKRLAELYSKATAVLYPPINEDYGLVPLEAMASSKPVIAVNEGGPRETVVNGVTGYLVDSEDDMAKMMLKIASDDALAERLGKNGRRLAVSKYSWSRFFKEFDKKLKKVASM